MSWFEKWVAASPENIGSRLFRGNPEQGESLLHLFMIAHSMRRPASMQELLLWVDAEADEVRRNYHDGFDWQKFQEKIIRQFDPSDANMKETAN
jgi:hypothetical protein